MSDHTTHRADTVLRAAWRACGTPLFATVGFSLCVNLLMLAGPLYMLQVYDRVLVSRSVPTLVALSAILAVLLLAMGVLEAVRHRLMNRVAGRLNGLLGPPLVDAVLTTEETRHADAQAALRDFGTVRKFLASPAPIAFFDLPWVPVYLGIVFLMHWSLGLVASAGAVLMLIIAVATDYSTRRRISAATDVVGYGLRLTTEATRSIDALLSMGMKDAVERRWVRAHDYGEIVQRNVADRIAAFSASTTTLRLMLQSALLGVGAYLAIDDFISPGMMIAASIIAGRALAPIGQIVSNFRGLLDAVDAHKRLGRVLKAQTPKTVAMVLPRPHGRLEVREIYAGPPGTAKPILQGVELTLEPGETVGIIGPSASGKSTLARILVGLWPPKRGSVRLAGSNVADWTMAQRGDWLGYLPQDVELMEGTVQENIGRFEANPDPSAIVRAAQMVDAHDLILRLPKGYDTKIGGSGRVLSAGQRQRVALARAVYRVPALVVLDEPNANLDAEGDLALTRTIRRLKKAGTTVVIVAHRPSAIVEVDKLLVLIDGKVRAFGPKNDVLLQMRQPGQTKKVQKRPKERRSDHVAA